MYKTILTILMLFMLLLMLAMGEKITKQASTISLMEKCLKSSDVIMDNNNIWDTDSSTYMDSYIYLRDTLDDTFTSKFHKTR